MNTTRTARRLTARRLTALLALPLAAAAAVCTAPPASAGYAGLPTVKICRDINFSGGCWESRESGWQNFTDRRGTGVWNDVASSIAVDRGCTLTVYTDYDRNGLFQSWDGSKGAFGDGDDDLRSSWVGNDRISTVSINCGA